MRETEKVQAVSTRVQEEPQKNLRLSIEYAHT